MALKIGMSIGIGMLVGMEREWSNKRCRDSQFRSGSTAGNARVDHGSRADNHLLDQRILTCSRHEYRQHSGKSILRNHDFCFEYYLDRHVQADADSHGPMTLQTVEELCGADNRKWEEAGLGAETALTARLDLWDGILNRIRRTGY